MNMQKQLSDTERRVLAVLQGGLPKTRSPYKDIAERAAITTEELLAILRKWKKEGGQNSSYRGNSESF